jgi:hypothetical protein
MGVRRQGCRQGNGELVVVWWVACGKKCEKLLKKKVVKIFLDGNFGGWSKKRSPNIPASRARN